MYIEIENLEADTIEVSELIEIPKGMDKEALEAWFDVQLDAHLDNASIREID